MQYTKTQIKSITRFASCGGKAKALIDQGASEDEAFEDLISKVNLDEEIYIPKLIECAGNISMATSIIAIVIVKSII